MSSIVHAAGPISSGTGSSQGGGIANFFPFLIIIGIFYFLLIRPQKKKANEHQKMLNELQRGNRIVTSGGIYGVISTMKGKIIEIKIADGVKIQVTRSSISGLANDDVQQSGNAQVTEAEIVKK